MFQGGNDDAIGISLFLFNTFLYGTLGLCIAFFTSTVLTYISVFNNSYIMKGFSLVLNLLSGIHIILFCFIIKIVIGHEEGFHLLILIAIGVGSYSYADIHQFQAVQFHKLLESDFIVAARAWGDSVYKHARRSIAIGLLSQWNSLIGTIFTSTIIIEYFFKIKGVGYALDRYLIRPNLNNPSQVVESEFFMLISSMIIVIVLLLSGIKERLIHKLSMDK